MFPNVSRKIFAFINQRIAFSKIDLLMRFSIPLHYLCIQLEQTYGTANNHWLTDWLTAMCTTWELPLKTTGKLQLVQHLMVYTVLGITQFALSIPQLYKLQWLSFSFWVQLKVLVIIFKVLHGMGPDYLRDCLFLRISFHSTKLDKQVCSISPLLNDVS